MRKYLIAMALVAAVACGDKAAADKPMDSTPPAMSAPTDSNSMKMGDSTMKMGDSTMKKPDSTKTP